MTSLSIYTRVWQFSMLIKVVEINSLDVRVVLCVKSLQLIQDVSIKGGYHTMKISLKTTDQSMNFTNTSLVIISNFDIIFIGSFNFDVHDETFVYVLDNTLQSRYLMSCSHVVIEHLLVSFIKDIFCRGEIKVMIKLAIVSTMNDNKMIVFSKPYLKIIQHYYKNVKIVTSNSMASIPFETAY